MQVTWVRFLVQEDPTCHRAANPTVHTSQSGGHAHTCTRTSAAVPRTRTRWVRILPPGWLRPGHQLPRTPPSSLTRSSCSLPALATEAGARSQGRGLLGQEAPAQAALPSQGAGGLCAESHRPPRGHTSVRRTHPSGPGAAVSLRGPASGVACRTSAKGRCHSALQECPRDALRPGHTRGAHVPPGTGPPGPGEGGPAPEPPRHHPRGFLGLTGEGPVPFPASAVPPATATGSYFLSEALPTQPLQHHPETTSFQGRLQHPPPAWELPGPGLLPHPETSAGKREADMGSGPALPAPKVTQPGQGTEAGPGRENPSGGLAGATALGLSWMLRLALAGRGTATLLWWGPWRQLLGPHLIPPRTLGPLEGVGLQGWFQGQCRVRGASRGLPDTEPPAAEPQPRPGRFPGRTIELPRAQTGGAGAGGSASPSNESHVSCV